MSTAGVVFLLIGLGFAAATYWVGVRAGWSKLTAVLVALIPVAFCFFMGIIGVLISAVFLPAVYKAADAMPA